MNEGLGELRVSQTLFYSQSPDLEFWGRHRHVMSTIKGDTSAWQSMKIGAGPVPIETAEGWLLFYHGVLNSCNGCADTVTGLAFAKADELISYIKENSL